MRYYVLYVLITSLYYNNGTAQVINWQNTIGGDSHDYSHSIKPCQDGGFICGGHSVSDNSGDKSQDCKGGYDYWIIKLDSLGLIQWDKTIGGSEDEFLYDINPTTDGGSILAGYSYSNTSGDKTENSIGLSDLWIIKLDSLGNIQWQNTIGGNNSEFSPQIRQTTDHGFICGTTSWSGISGDKSEMSFGFGDYWIIKLDSSGNIQWQKTIGGINRETFTSICQTIDNGFIAGGYSESGISGNKSEPCYGYDDYFIVKLDSNGTIEWQNTVGGDQSDQLISIKQTNDARYICGGHSRSDTTGDKTEISRGIYDYWIIELDQNGNIQWQKTLGGNDGDYFKEINLTNDGGYICGGSSGSNISGEKSEDSRGLTDYWIIKLDSIGTPIGQKTIGGNSFDHCFSVSQTMDGYYICGGYSNSNISGDKTENNVGSLDIWVIKLSDQLSSIDEHFAEQSQFTVYPNPAKSSIYISNKNLNNLPVKSIKIRDILGIERNFSVTYQMDTLELNIENFANGVYIISLYLQNGGNKTIRIIVLR